MSGSAPGPRGGRPAAPDFGAMAVGFGLLVVAGVIYADAAQMSMAPLYAKIGPKVVPEIVAAGLAFFGLLTVFGAFRGWFPEREGEDLAGAAWVAAGLVTTILSLLLKIGFIPAMTALFAFTARAMGRRALLADSAIGAVIGLSVYLVFTKLLSLSLPRGPLESLL
jgi:putative tricarboxylic transport membrane protein